MTAAIAAAITVRSAFAETPESIEAKPAAELTAAETVAAMAVPVAFNGDQLATMEAVYADGTVAGPQNRTSCKEFAVAFEPDYEAGRIVLPEAFFAEVNDGSTVHLTFHFWSGATVEYTLQRSGTAVTGSAA